MIEKAGEEEEAQHDDGKRDLFVILVALPSSTVERACLVTIPQRWRKSLNLIKTI